MQSTNTLSHEGFSLDISPVLIRYNTQVIQFYINEHVYLRDCIAAAFRLHPSEHSFAIRDPNTRAILPLSYLYQIISSASISFSPENPLELIISRIEYETYKESKDAQSDFAYIVQTFLRYRVGPSLSRQQFQAAMERLLSESERYHHAESGMYDQIFQLFATSDTEYTDMQSFLTGLSVIIEGNEEEKLCILFELYDSNHKGFIELDDMERYITAVYQVMLLIASEQMQYCMDAAEFARVILAQYLTQSVSIGSGNITPASFREWYMRPDKLHISCKDTELPWHILTVGTALNTMSISTIMSDLSQHCTTLEHRIVLLRDDFVHAFSADDDVRAVRALYRLFDAMDENREEALEMETVKDKLRNLKGFDINVLIAFDLADTDKNNYISTLEMENFLTYVFETTQFTNDSIVSAQCLAHYTTCDIFLRYCPDKELTLESFHEYYNNETESHFSQAWRQYQSFQLPENTANTNTISVTADEYGNTRMNSLICDAVQRFSELTQLHYYKSGDVFEVIAAKVNDEGVLSRELFHQAFSELHSLRNQTEIVSNRSVIDRIFDIFDTDHDGDVDFCELASGLSILCAGSNYDNLRAAFALFDILQDNRIAREEMETFFASVFRMLYGIAPEIVWTLRMTCEELALFTVQKMFDALSSSLDNRLSFDQVETYYKAQQTQNYCFLPLVASEVGEKEKETEFIAQFLSLESCGSALQHLKEMTNLSSFDVADVMEYFGQAGNEQCELDRRAFLQCFYQLLDASKRIHSMPIVSSTPITDSPQSEKHCSAMNDTVQQLLNEIFDLFDTDQNGYIDVVELSAGISILCGGNLQERAASLFRLYDTDKNGTISMEEMNLNLLAIFKILYKANPQLQSQLGISPNDLAYLTTRECFSMFDKDKNKQLSLSEFTEYITAQRDRVHCARTDKTAEKVDFEQAFDLFCETADDNGHITLAQFQALFTQLSRSFTASRLHQLFLAYTAENHGHVHLFQIAGAVSAFFASAEQLFSVFCTFETQQTGIVSGTSLSIYLTSYLQFGQLFFEGICMENLHLPLSELANLLDTEDMDFERFCQWHETLFPPQLQALFAPYTLDQARKLLHLDFFSITDVFEMFAELADDQNRLVRDNYLRIFDDIRACALNLPLRVEKFRGRAIALRIFDVLKTKDSDSINFIELACSLLVFCKGARDAKLRAAFNLLDFNGDGCISQADLTRYLRSNFCVLSALEPGLLDGSAEELATITGNEAFKNVETMTLTEFCRWYSSLSPLSRGKELLMRAEQREKRFLCLHQLQSEELHDIIELHTEGDESVSPLAFEKIFHAVSSENVHDNTYSDTSDALFAAFDVEKKGYIDRRELYAGLVVLCAGTQAEKVNAGIASFVKVSFSISDLAQYLSSVFCVLYRYSQPTMDVPPNELGRITAKRAFEDLHCALTERVSVAQFQNWYAQPGNMSRIMHSVDAETFCRALGNLSLVNEEDCITERKLMELLSDSSYQHANESVQHLKTLAQELFQILDVEDSATVVFSEWCRGWAILSGGYSRTEAERAFAAFDLNGDGLVSKNEMICYLTAVFYFLKTASPPNAMTLQFRDRNGSIDALAAQTAAHAFPNEHAFSFDAFCAWYARSSAACMERLIHANVSEYFVYAELRRLSSIQYSYTELFSDTETLDQAQCVQRFSSIANSANDTLANLQLGHFASQFFNLLDTRKEGTLSACTIHSKLQKLFQDANDVSAAFDLYDLDKNGSISIRELSFYLTCLFQSFYEMNANVREQMQMSAKELGNCIALQALEEADLNGDRKLSLKEFQLWYLQPQASQRDETNEMISFQSVRELTQLNTYAIDQVLEALAEFGDTENGLLSRKAFYECAHALRIKKDPSAKENDPLFQRILHRIFSAFESEGYVDFCELSTGLSVFCKGSQKANVQAAFALYDVNHDNVLTLEEMARFLHSVYRVLYALYPTHSVPVSVDELALTMAEQCFVQYDSDRDGKLTLDEFTEYYVRQRFEEQMEADMEVKLALKSISASLHGTLTSQEKVQRLLCLHRYSVSDLHELFQEIAPSGELQYEAYHNCFQKLFYMTSEQTLEEKEEAMTLVQRLFLAMDHEKSNAIDCKAFVNGISVLSHSYAEEKLNAAFGLGAHDLQQLTNYFSSVLSVLCVFELVPSVKDIKLLASRAAERFFAMERLSPQDRIAIHQIYKCVAFFSVLYSRLIPLTVAY